jgi:hypothetical protein
VAQLKQAAFRADDALLARLDRAVEVLQASPDFAGVDVKRSTVIRALVLRGLASLEIRHGIYEDLPRDPSFATIGYWNRRQRELIEELETVERFIHEYEAKLADVKSEAPPPPRRYKGS